MGWQLALYLGLTRVLRPFAPAYLRRRLNRGREDPLRWREKLGEPGLVRPNGRLVWLHAVGLGEVMALRGLIAAMAAREPDLSFLMTSMARSSGQVIAGNLPARTQHQYLPLDAPAFVSRFLDHWRPDLSIWSEQEIWPTAITLCARRKIPLALVNARMNATAFARRQRGRNLLADIYAKFSYIAAQDSDTARYLTMLGAAGVQVCRSLKAASPALLFEPDALVVARAATAGRKVWLAASTHPEDEAIALAVQRQLFAQDDRWLLILVPREPQRGAAIVALAEAQGLPTTLRSMGQEPGGAVQIADTYGELGLWYRLCPIALIGGTFGAVEGHNPWEPAALGCAILHGPRVANFAADFAALDQAQAAVAVTPETLADALTREHGDVGARASALWQAARGSLDPLAGALLGLMGPR